MQLEWVKTYYLLAQIDVAAAGILLWQYARRNTFATRILAAAAILAALATGDLLPWTAAFALQTHFSRQKIDVSSIQIQLDSQRKWSGRVYAAGESEVVANVPLRIDGLPAETKLMPNGLTLMLRGADGKRWVLHRPPPNCVDFEHGITSVQATMSRAFYESVKSEPLQLHGTLYFTLYRSSRSALIVPDGTAVPVNGLGLCSATPRLLLCKSAFRLQSDWVGMRIAQDAGGGLNETTEDSPGIGSYSPFPTGLTIDPLYHFSSVRLAPMFEARIDAFEPVAYVEKTFTIDGLRLGDFPFRN